MAAARHNAITAYALLACCVLVGACSAAYDRALPRAEKRAPIELSAKERERLRAGMRVYLECIEGITDGLAESKMSAVARSAERCGTDMIVGVSVPDVLALTPEFLALSLDTHQKFDALAKEAGEHLTRSSALKELGAILHNCTACHAAYRFAP